MKKMITILGPTASGKTRIATALAVEIGAEIISADSRQVYKNMDIGTGKDLCDYTIAGKNIPYHLIDIVEPGTKYNVYEYQRDFFEVYEDNCRRGVNSILCGGSGLYIEAVLKGYQLMPVPQSPELRAKLEGKSLSELTEMLVELKSQNKSKMHNNTDVDTAQRAIRAIEIEEYYKHTPFSGRQVPKIDSLIIGVNIDRDERRKKITDRLKQRLASGMLDEIKSLLDAGIPPENLIYYGLEYKFVTEYLMGKTTYQDMFDKLEIAIHQFSKRQMTWFRGMERRGFEIHWIDAMHPIEENIKEIKDLWQ